MLQTDSNQVGQLIRLQNTLTPLNDNEIAIKYKIQNRRIFLGAESFFFEEGQATLYQNAMYSGLKVDDKGESLLVGLYNENFQYIQPDK
ncbi:GDYXXLXY domain-containing protein [Bacteroides acidifaciens]|uniref:GDYXXLXY domain-containing protein n=1 Tax=uncultured Bacteroides sp. TaxID=162156 RepID=UPI00301489C1